MIPIVRTTVCIKTNSSKSITILFITKRAITNGSFKTIEEMLSPIEAMANFRFGL